MLDNRQPQAGATQLARAGLVDAVEPLEDARQLRLGDADAGVANLQAATAVLRPPGQADRAPLRRVLQRVVDEVVEDLADRLLVGPRRRRPGAGQLKALAL